MLDLKYSFARITGKTKGYEYGLGCDEGRVLGLKPKDI